MTPLLALLLSAPSFALNIFILDDGDSNTSNLMSELRAAGHTVTSSYGTYGWKESDFNSSRGITLSSYDAVIWLDGADETSDEMSSTGQALLYSYVSGGGGLLLFGATGYAFSGYGHYSSYRSLIPLRSSSWAGDRTWTVSTTHPVTTGLASSFSVDSGVILDSSSSFGTDLFSYTYVYTTYIGGVAATVGSGRLVQLGLWGNTTSWYSSYETNWTDDNVATMVENALQWIVQRPPDLVLPASFTVEAEGSVTLAATSASDPDGGSLSWAWDVGSDGSVECTTSTCTWTASGYDGPVSRKLSVTVTDDEGQTATADAELLITNVAPVITGRTLPSGLDEGSSGSLAVSFTDVEAADTHTVFWSFGDGDTGSGTPTTHAWRDEGSYTVTFRVQDDDGGAASASGTVTVNNVAPTLTGTPGGTATVGRAYTFTPGAYDPGIDDVLTFGGSVPTGATISSSTGQVSWTPTRDQVGSHALRLTVDDGDGGNDTLEWTVEVQLSDRDGDGMPDEWEDSYGLSADDPRDAALDPDGDGRTSLEEYLGDSDPTTYEGPGVPALRSPADGSRIGTDTPTLVVGAADAPLGQALRYGFEVFSDAALRTSVGGVEGVAAGGAETSWTWTGGALRENTDYWWTAWAEDDYVAGAEASPFTFFVNAINEAPGVPTLLSPLAGGVVETLSPAFLLGETTDPDRDELRYRFGLLDEVGRNIDAGAGVSPSAGQATWTATSPLVDGATYCWLGAAEDPGGLIGPYTEEACFIVDTTNDAPSAPQIIDPLDGAVLRDSWLVVQAINGEDPEGRSTVHEFQLDRSPGFDSPELWSATLPTDASGLTTWAPAEALAVEGTWYLRARCSDGARASDWDSLSFELRLDGGGLAPGAPTLISPANGQEVDGAVAFQVGAAVDPDGDELLYETLVLDRAGNLVRGESGLAMGDGGVLTWSPAALEPGIYAWTARATDSTGLAGAWASSATFAVAGEDEGSPQDEETMPKGCACASGTARPASLGLLLLPALVGWGRRRRRP